MKTVLLLSGGIDSSTLLFQLKFAGHEVLPLAVYYGQRHEKELIAAHNIAMAADVPLTEVQLGDLTQVMKGSSQTDLDVPVPHGHYADESMKITVVPNRNMILLSIAGALAVSKEAKTIAYAAHAGDHFIYPDCRPPFIIAMQEAFKQCHFEPISLWAPFQNLSKTEIVKLGHELLVPYPLTWSCYEGGVDHCGKCGTCVERREAFREARVEDPTVYAHD